MPALGRVGCAGVRGPGEGSAGNRGTFRREITAPAASGLGAGGFGCGPVGDLRESIVFRISVDWEQPVPVPPRHDPKEGPVSLDTRKKLFTMRVGRPWHRLPRETTAAPSLEVSKAGLDGAWSTLG